MASTSELACVYSALILSDDDIEITSDKLTTLLKAASVDFEPYWPNLFAKALVGRNIKDLISNVGTGAGAPAAGAPAAVATGGGGDAPDAPAEEKKPEKVEEEEESDEDMGFGLFD